MRLHFQQDPLDPLDPLDPPDPRDPWDRRLNFQQAQQGQQDLWDRVRRDVRMSACTTNSRHWRSGTIQGCKG